MYRYDQVLFTMQLLTGPGKVYNYSEGGYDYTPKRNSQETNESRQRPLGEQPLVQIIANINTNSYLKLLSRLQRHCRFSEVYTPDINISYSPLIKKYDHGKKTKQRVPLYFHSSFSCQVKVNKCPAGLEPTRRGQRQEKSYCENTTRPITSFSFHDPKDFFWSATALKKVLFQSNFEKCKMHLRFKNTLSFYT